MGINIADRSNYYRKGTVLELSGKPHCFWQRLILRIIFFCHIYLNELLCLITSCLTFKICACVCFPGWCFGGWIWPATDSCIINKRWIKTAAPWLKNTFICRRTFIHIRAFEVKTLHRWSSAGLCVFIVTNYMLACSHVVYWTFPFSSSSCYTYQSCFAVLATYKLFNVYCFILFLCVVHTILSESWSLFPW